MEEYDLDGAQIIDTKGAPPELVRLAHNIIEEYEKVELVLFDAFIEDLENAMGAFNPTNKIIIIDMGACISQRYWMSKGIMYIPNVWFNLLYTLFHETAHARQLEEDPTIALLDKLPEEYEKDAHEMARISLLDWTNENDVPPLDEMGWVGDEIKRILNKVYAQTPDIVTEELDIERTVAAANALHVALVDGGEEYKAKLFNSIDIGDSGIKINGKRYLTALEAISFT